MWKTQKHLTPGVFHILRPVPLSVENSDTSEGPDDPTARRGWEQTFDGFERSGLGAAVGFHQRSGGGAQPRALDRIAREAHAHVAKLGGVGHLNGGLALQKRIADLGKV